MGRRKGDGDTASSVRASRLFRPLFFVPSDHRSLVTSYVVCQLENLVQNYSSNSSRRKHEYVFQSNIVTIATPYYIPYKYVLGQLSGTV